MIFKVVTKSDHCLQPKESLSGSKVRSRREQTEQMKCAENQRFRSLIEKQKSNLFEQTIFN